MFTAVSRALLCTKSIIVIFNFTIVIIYFTSSKDYAILSALEISLLNKCLFFIHWIKILHITMDIMLRFLNISKIFIFNEYFLKYGPYCKPRKCSRQFVHNNILNEGMQFGCNTCCICLLWLAAVTKQSSEILVKHCLVLASSNSSLKEKLCMIRLHVDHIILNAAGTRLILEQALSP